MSFDILHDFSKPEIIQWAREKAFTRVRKSDLLFIRWRLAAAKIQHDYQQELDHWEANKPDFAERDRLARLCNEARDLQEKIRLLEKIRPYDVALQQHMARCKKLDQRQEQVDGLHRKYEKQRDVECAQEQS